MFKSSITKFLIASLGILMAGLFVAALILAVQAWSNYALAGRIARLTRTDDTLFNALVTVRAQIPKDSTALIAQDDPRLVMGATHREASLTVAAAIEALQATDMANRAQFVTAIQTAWRKAEALQFTVEAQASRVRAERDLHAIDAWREAVHGMTDTLSTASAAVGNAVRMGDLIIAEMVQIRRTAWIIRDRYGLQCSMLRPNVDRSLPLDAGQLDLWHGDRAIYTNAWHTLDEFLLRPGVSAALRERIDVARTKTKQAQIKVDAIVDRFDGSGKPVVASAEWTALCDGPFDSILAIGQQAQDEANGHAEAMRAASSRMLLVAGMDLTSVIAFAAFAVVNVQRRLARPMKATDWNHRPLEPPRIRPSGTHNRKPRRVGQHGSGARDLAHQRARSRASAAGDESVYSRCLSPNANPPYHFCARISRFSGDLIPANHAAYSSLKDIQEAADRLQRLLIQLLKLARADGGPSLDRESGTIDLPRGRSGARGEACAAGAGGRDRPLHFEAEQAAVPRTSQPNHDQRDFRQLSSTTRSATTRPAAAASSSGLFDEKGKHVVDVP